MAYNPLPITNTANGNPSIHLWNRLETRPRSQELNRSLRAEIRDAAWLLSRQWQVGEFRAEDRASIAFAHIEMETKPVPYYWPFTDNHAQPFDQAHVPLETLVESEPVPLEHGVRVQIGEYWLRLVRRALEWMPNPGFRNFRENLARWEELQLPPVPNENEETELIPYLQQLTQPGIFQDRAITQAVAFDGYALYELLNDQSSRGIIRMRDFMVDYFCPST